MSVREAAAAAGLAVFGPLSLGSLAFAGSGSSTIGVAVAITVSIVSVPAFAYSLQVMADELTWGMSSGGDTDD